MCSNNTETNQTNLFIFLGDRNASTAGFEFPFEHFPKDFFCNCKREFEPTLIRDVVFLDPQEGLMELKVQTLQIGQSNGQSQQSFVERPREERV